MTTNLRHWTLAVVLLCATATVVLLPVRPGLTWMDWGDTRLAVERARAWVATGRFDGAAREYRTSRMLDRWSSSAGATTPTPVTIDGTVPSEVSAKIDSLLRLEWRRLGASASAERAAAFVVLDTTHLVPPGHSREMRRPLEVSYVLPRSGAASNDRCLTLVRVGTTAPSALGVVPTGSLFGPCGFYAVYGPPGVQVYEWLARTEFASARLSDWATPRAPPIWEWFDLSEEAASCSVLADSSCLSGLGLVARNRPGRAPSAPPPATNRSLTMYLLPTVPSPVGGLVGREDARLLADLRRKVGEERFRKLWSSSGTVPEAFAAAAGMPASEWISEWLGRPSRSARAKAGVLVNDIIWIAVALPLLLAAAARRRESVLAGRSA